MSACIATVILAAEAPPGSACPAILASMPDPQTDLVELTRRSMMDTNDGDFDAATAVFAEDAVFDVSEAGIGRFSGREAVRAYARADRARCGPGAGRLRRRGRAVRQRDADRARARVAAGR